MRTFAAALTCLCMSGAWAADAIAPTAAPPAASATELGKVEVQGHKPRLESLQQMKAAIDTPFSNDPKHYDDMVCRLEDNLSSHVQGMVLDCGTQGWFGMRRSIYRRDMMMTPNPDLSSTPPLGHPWHILRALNPEQVTALRKMLGTLPPPEKGDLEVEGDGTPAPAAGTATSP
jgi:hypothetical protein